MKIENNKIFGYAPTHPGSLLKEEIEYRGIAFSKIAEQMEIPLDELMAVLDEKSPVIPELAMLFEAVLGIDSGLLLRMQYKYNLQTARQNKSFIARLARIRRMAAAATL